jgi:hypothetical protein
MGIFIVDTNGTRARVKCDVAVDAETKETLIPVLRTEYVDIVLT